MASDLAPILLSRKSTGLLYKGTVQFLILCLFVFPYKLFNVFTLEHMTAGTGSCEALKPLSVVESG